MSEPTGPQESLLVAVTVSEMFRIGWKRGISTISDFDLGCCVALCNVLDTPHDLGHGTGGSPQEPVEVRLNGGEIRVSGCGEWRRVPNVSKETGAQ